MIASARTGTVFSLVLVLLLGGCARRAPATGDAPPEPVCFECFWRHQDPALREELLAVYESYETDDPVVRADVRYLLGRILGDGERVCASFRQFAGLREDVEGPDRLLLVDETLAFTARECGQDPEPLFENAARSARSAGQDWKAEVYSDVAHGRFRPRFGETTIRTNLPIPEEVEAFVLGESRIQVDPGHRVGVQVERTVRDWLSYQMKFDYVDQDESEEDLLWYHEGARMKELLGLVPAKVEALSGTLVARRGNEWYAPDERGVFRFEVLPDKVQYPTTRYTGGLALLVDTHGVSSLVQAAIREGVDLVVGCGDHSGKVEAAYHLARRGVDVYFPCDRFVGDLIGHKAEGVLLGSAPIRAVEGGAMIGDVPVTFRLEEVIVVQDTDLRGRYQYYDAPARYFRRLAELVPLRIEWIRVDGPGQSHRIAERAREIGASAIAVRVETEADYVPVHDWLGESTDHRAVLFHTAPYADGYRLFEEFPAQTTFGDPRPRFLPPDDRPP